MKRIKFPSSYFNVNDVSTFRANLENLEQLVRLHLLAFPFENSQLHYTTNHVVDVDTQSVYRRLVENREGGSWCCGQNGLFLGMLRGLGYRAYAASGRVNASPPTAKEPTSFTFLTHLVLLVQISHESTEPSDNSIAADPNVEETNHTTYLVDVGFGGNGPVRPIRLKVGQTDLGSAPPEEHRLVRGMHPDSSLEEDGSHHDWLLQFRCGTHQPDWKALYLFGESETFPGDWVAFSQWLSQHPVEPFLSNVTCIQHFVAEPAGEGEGDEGRDAPLGRMVMMGRKVQKRVGDRSETVKEFFTERERVNDLKSFFGITVNDGDVQNISQTAAGLPIF